MEFTFVMSVWCFVLLTIAFPAFIECNSQNKRTKPVMAANQTSQCNPCSRGPPGRDGRDGPPGPTSPISHQDYLNIKKELEQELKTVFIDDLLANKTILSTKQASTCDGIGRTPDKSASSCRAIFLCDDTAPSGEYWIKGKRDRNYILKQVYCNMEDTRCGIRGGWMRVAHIDMSDRFDNCPPPLRTVTSPKRMCGRSTVGGGCSSVLFPTCGVPYTRVCGRAVGYAYYTPEGFQPKANGINAAYVDGLSISHGHPRKHLWTYAAGGSEDYSYPLWNCPCAVHPGPNPPSFVGQHYHCESGNTGTWENQWYTADPLWDGEGCNFGSNCCSTSGLPWFCRTLPCKTTDDIEVRWCASQAISDEDVTTELLEIYTNDI